MKNPFEEIENSIVSLKKKGHQKVTVSIYEFESLINAVKNLDEENKQLKEKIKEAINYCEMDEPLLAIDIMNK